MSELHTFRHIAIHRDGNLKEFKPVKKWHPQPPPEAFTAFFPQYIEWMHVVNLEVAHLINKDHRFIVYDQHAENPFWEMWVYHANGQKECIAKCNGRFSP